MRVYKFFFSLLIASVELIFSGYYIGNLIGISFSSANQLEIDMMVLFIKPFRKPKSKALLTNSSFPTQFFLTEAINGVRLFNMKHQKCHLTHNAIFVTSFILWKLISIQHFHFSMQNNYEMVFNSIHSILFLCCFFILLLYTQTSRHLNDIKPPVCGTFSLMYESISSMR